jgi:hypothetical protein
VDHTSYTLLQADAARGRLEKDRSAQKKKKTLPKEKEIKRREGKNSNAKKQQKRRIHSALFSFSFPVFLCFSSFFPPRRTGGRDGAKPEPIKKSQYKGRRERER